MRILGIDLFESKKEQYEKSNAYNALIFPYGDFQQAKIKEILSSLFPNSIKEEVLFNYIIAKEKFVKINFSNYSNEEILELIKELNHSFITKEKNAEYYLALLIYEKDIDENLKYPSIEEIKQKALDIIKAN